MPGGCPSLGASRGLRPRARRGRRVLPGSRGAAPGGEGRGGCRSAVPGFGGGAAAFSGGCGNRRRRPGGACAGCGRSIAGVRARSTLAAIPFAVSPQFTTALASRIAIALSAAVRRAAAAAHQHFMREQRSGSPSELDTRMAATSAAPSCEQLFCAGAVCRPVPGLWRVRSS